MILAYYLAHDREVMSLLLFIIIFQPTHRTGASSDYQRMAEQHL